MRFWTFYRIALFLFVFSFSACSYNPKQFLYVHKMAEVDYLVYMAADNNLERFGIKNIKALQEVGSSANANILVLFDRSPGYDRSEGNRNTTDLFFITKNPKSMNDDIIKSYGELDMTDPNVLYNFLAMANTYFPSKHIILNIWSHGRGVYPDGVISKAVIEDYTSGYGVKNMMSVCDLNSAILEFENNTNKRVDVVQFDACDMQMVEVLYQLKNITDYIIGADTQIPGGGSDYRAIAEYLANNEFDKEKFSKFLVKSFYEFEKTSGLKFSYCAVKTSVFDNFVSIFNEFCDRLKRVLEEGNYALIKNVRDNLEELDSAYKEFCDLGELLQEIPNEVEKSDLLQHLDNLIIGSKSTFDSNSNIVGLGINFPPSSNEMSYYYKDDNEYAVFDFYKNTLWDEFLISYFENLNKNN